MSGVKYVAKSAVSGVKYVAKATVSGARYVAKATVSGAKAVASKATSLVKAKVSAAKATAKVVVNKVQKVNKTVVQPAMKKATSAVKAVANPKNLNNIVKGTVRGYVTQSLSNASLGTNAAVNKALKINIDKSATQDLNSLGQLHYYIGKVAADVAGGAAGLGAVIVGGSGDVAGGGLTITGGGAAIGVPAMAASTAVAGYGYGLGAKSVASLGNDVNELFYYVKSSGGSSEGTPKTIKTNLGNEIDITPSSNHSTTTKNPGLNGKANSSVDILDSNRNIKTRRWYGPDGKQIRDVDFTNHGNSKVHPEWPHEHGPR